MDGDVIHRTNEVKLMKFEEQFPELKATNIHKARQYVANILRTDFYEKSDIQKHCRSVKRIREAIEKWRGSKYDEFVCYHELLKELNL